MSKRDRRLAGYMRRRRAAAEATILAEDWQLWELKRAGLSDEQIGAKLGLSRNAVQGRLSRIMTTYRAAMTHQVEAKAGELIAQYEYIRDEALEAWRRSTQDVRRVSQTTTERRDATGQPAGDGGAVVSTTVGTESASGDPKHLETALKAMDKIARLLRIDQGLTVNIQGNIAHTHQGAGGGPIRVVHDVNYDELETDRLAAYLQRLGQAAVLVAAPLLAQPVPAPVIDVTPVDAGGAE